MRKSHRRPAPIRYACLVAATGVAALLSSIVVPSSTETAAANGDTRTLNLYHSHTGESIQATFRVNGSYDPAALEKLNWFLRDWRNNDRTRMDPRLFDVVWEAYRTAGATQPIVIVSAYRSPQTNAMLRRRSHGVAEHSQHILGRAMDTTMPGMPMERIREIGMRLQHGGVGWYPSSNFVHLDVGSVRAWPRMSYDQLARLFPDGKTVHLAADGRALPRYQEARAEIASRGGVLSDVPQAAPSGGLFAWLFGKHEEEDEADAAGPQSVQPRASHGRTEVAALRMSGANTAGTVSANPGVPTDRGNARAATAAPASAAGKDSPQNEPSPADANRTRVADLGSAPILRGNRTAIEQGRDERQEGDEKAADILKETIDKRAASAATAPIPPPRPAQPGDVAVAFADMPTPPARPASLTRVAALAADQTQGEGDNQVFKNDPTNDAAAASSANSPLARAANLPVVITQGPKRSRQRAEASACVRIGDTGARSARSDAEQHAGRHHERTGRAIVCRSGPPRPDQASRSRQRSFNHKFPGPVDPWTILHRPAPGGPQHSRCAFKQGFAGLCRGLQDDAKRSRPRPFHRSGDQAPRTRARLCPHHGKPGAASPKLSPDNFVAAASAPNAPIPRP